MTLRSSALPPRRAEKPQASSAEIHPTPPRSEPVRQMTLRAMSPEGAFALHITVGPRSAASSAGIHQGQAGPGESNLVLEALHHRGAMVHPAGGGEGLAQVPLVH